MHGGNPSPRRRMSRFRRLGASSGSRRSGECTARMAEPGRIFNLRPARWRCYQVDVVATSTSVQVWNRVRRMVKSSAAQPCTTTASILRSRSAPCSLEATSAFSFCKRSLLSKNVRRCLDGHAGSGAPAQPSRIMGGAVRHEMRIYKRISSSQSSANQVFGRGIQQERQGSSRSRVSSCQGAA